MPGPGAYNPGFSQLDVKTDSVSHIIGKASMRRTFTTDVQNKMVA